MFDPEELPDIRGRIQEQTRADATLLSEVLADVERIRPGVRAIQPRETTSVSLVASDGGNNKIEFNPFYIQLVRVVDSYGEALFLDVVSPTSDTTELGERHLADENSPLGKLMRDLKVKSLSELSPMLPARPRSPSWTLWYREICEWATLYDLIRYQRFATDTLIVKDGFLRSKVFSGDLFVRMGRLMMETIERTARERRRDLFLVGIAKRSQVLQQYSLAMAIADVLPSGSPRFAPVPIELQEKAYAWDEYIRRPYEETTKGEPPKFNIGEMFFVRFGTRSGDPIWTVDVAADQRGRAQEIFGCLLADAIVGFPIPFYPMCLQQADHFAQVVDLDLDILQDTLVEAVREQVVPHRRVALDAQLLATDVIQRRYG